MEPEDFFFCKKYNIIKLNLTLLKMINGKYAISNDKKIIFVKVLNP